MNDYLLGTDILGAAWGEPAFIDDADWGHPVVVQQIENEVLGHGGRGGRGHGGPRGGAPRVQRSGFRGWGPGYVVDDMVDVACTRWDADGNCLEYSAVDVLGDDITVLGYIDIQQAQRQMNSLKAVTIGVAQVLLKGGFEAIDGAIRTAQSKKLPNLKTLENMRGKLIWHRDNLGKFGDRNAPYRDANDLKRWVVDAYVQANGVEEGALYIDQAWTTMWNEISSELAKIPQKFRDEAANAVQNITGLPVWAWGLVAGGVLVLIGGVVYMLANSKAGAAVAGIAAKTYMR
jgi:hypothetical protein